MKNLFQSIAYSLILTQLSSGQTPSIYDVIQSQGLPPGLFPIGITNFTIDPSSGHFTARLNQSCDANLETHFHYSLNISGTIKHGEISDIAGVSAQDLFLWFPVNSIKVDIPSSGIVHFDVGVVRKQFSMSLFEIPPECTVSEADPPISTAASVLVNRRSSIHHPQKPVKTIGSEQEAHQTVFSSDS